MPLPSVAEGAYFPPAFETMLEKHDAVVDLLVYPSTEFGSAQQQLSYGFTHAMPLITQGVVYKAGEPLHSIDEADSRESLEAILALDGFNSLLVDREHSGLDRLAALATGIALSVSNADLAQHGFELGKRIIGQRARLNAHSLVSALLNARADLGFDVGRSLIRIAGDYHDKRGRRTSALASVPPAIGKQFDTIAERVYEDDGFDESHVAPLPIKGGRLGFLGKAAFTIKSAKTITSLSMKVRDPETASAAIEEVFDTYMGYPVLRMQDRETFLVGSFAQKVRQFYDVAGRAVAEVGEDPRVRHIGMLVDRLSGLNISKAEEVFKKTAQAIGKKEKQPSN